MNRILIPDRAPRPRACPRPDHPELGHHPKTGPGPDRQFLYVGRLGRHQQVRGHGGGPRRQEAGRDAAPGAGLGYRAGRQQGAGRKAGGQEHRRQRRHDLDQRRELQECRTRPSCSRPAGPNRSPMPGTSTGKVRPSATISGSRSTARSRPGAARSGSTSTTVRGSRQRTCRAALQALATWIEAHPGRFTFPAPPNFSGNRFLRQAMFELAGGQAQFVGPYKPELWAKTSPILWNYVKTIQPNLWRRRPDLPGRRAEPVLAVCQRRDRLCFRAEHRWNRGRGEKRRSAHRRRGSSYSTPEP